MILVYVLLCFVEIFPSIIATIINTSKQSQSMFSYKPEKLFDTSVFFYYVHIQK